MGTLEIRLAPSWAAQTGESQKLAPGLRLKLYSKGSKSARRRNPDPQTFVNQLVFLVVFSFVPFHPFRSFHPCPFQPFCWMRLQTRSPLRKQRATGPAHLGCSQGMRNGMPPKVNHPGGGFCLGWIDRLPRFMDAPPLQRPPPPPDGPEDGFFLEGWRFVSGAGGHLRPAEIPRGEPGALHHRRPESGSWGVGQREWGLWGVLRRGFWGVSGGKGANVGELGLLYGFGLERRLGVGLQIGLTHWTLGARNSTAAFGKFMRSS